VATRPSVIVVAALGSSRFWYRTLLPVSMPQTEQATVRPSKQTLWAYDFRAMANRDSVRLSHSCGLVIGGQRRLTTCGWCGGLLREAGASAQYKLHQIVLATWISRNCVSG